MRELAILILVSLPFIAAAAAASEVDFAGRRILETVELPKPGTDGTVSVEKALAERRSVRSFTTDPLTLDEVSQLLWSAYGITYTRDGMPDFVRGGLRTAPSAGALYPLEVYLVAGNVEGLRAGLYRYVSDGHLLQMLIGGDLRLDLQRACHGQRFVGSAPASIVYSAIYERCTSKYGERGRERYVCMDLGHSGQNVYLQCEALGLGTCAVGAFDDEAVHKVMRLSEEEEALYVMPVGRVEKGN